MTLPSHRRRSNALAAGTALALVLTGCTGGIFAGGPKSASAEASSAPARGTGGKAVRRAEAAVAAAPQDAARRVMLGGAYLEAGRFAAAETSYAEAMALGDTSSSVVVTRALSLAALGRSGEALALLNGAQDRLDPADYGLALALAGDAPRGAYILGDALRNGQNTPKMRQNFAYALALAGDWRTARLLVAEDVPANKVDARLAEWAETADPQAATRRVAQLLGVEAAANDPGRPAQLALANTPSVEQLAAEAVQGELPALAAAEPAPAPQPVSQMPAVPSVTLAMDTPAAPTPVQPSTPPVRARPVAAPVRTAAAPRVPAAKPAPAKPAAAKPGSLQRGDHMAQLGSYLSPADAKAAIATFQARYASLRGAQFAVTQAVVKGRTYYRVAAADLSPQSARAVCGAVKSGGTGCLVYARANPLPGTVAAQTRMASR